MMSADAQDDAVFKALCDVTRRRALDLLRDGPMTTGELCARLERHADTRAHGRHAEPALGRTGVLRHLAVLMDAGLVVTRAQGRVRWNHLNAAPLQRVCDRWMSRHVQMFATAFNRLKAFAEADSTDHPAPAPPTCVSTPTRRQQQQPAESSTPSLTPRRGRSARRPSSQSKHKEHRRV